MLQATKKVEYFCKTDKRLVLQRVFLNAKENKQTNKQDEQTDKETNKQVEQTDGETEKEMQTKEGGREKQTEAETDSS